MTENQQIIEATATNLKERLYTLQDAIRSGGLVFDDIHKAIGKLISLKENVSLDLQLENDDLKKKCAALDSEKIDLLRTLQDTGSKLVKEREKNKTIFALETKIKDQAQTISAQAFQIGGYQGQAKELYYSINLLREEKNKYQNEISDARSIVASYYKSQHDGNITISALFMNAYKAMVDKIMVLESKQTASPAPGINDIKELAKAQVENESLKKQINDLNERFAEWYHKVDLKSLEIARQEHVIQALKDENSRLLTASVDTGRGILDIIAGRYMQAEKDLEATKADLASVRLSADQFRRENDQLKESLKPVPCSN